MIGVLVAIVSGFWILFRKLDHLNSSGEIDSSTMTKIGTAYLSWCLALHLFLHSSPPFLVIGIFLPIVFFDYTGRFLKWRRRRDFRRFVLPMLSQMILQMKSGRSFRESLRSVVARSPSHTRREWELVVEHVVFSPQLKSDPFDRFQRELLTEFQFIDRASHSAIQRLEAIRSKLSVEAEFRRKSGQILLQMRMQSLMMLGLYIALVLFLVRFFGWQGIRQVLPYSMCLFVSGLVCAFYLGRRLKWNI